MTSAVARPSARIAAFAFGYFAITSLTIAATRYDGGLALVWLGTGVAAAMLAGVERAQWPWALMAIMVASAMATSLFGFGPHLAAPLAVVNAFEAWLTARLLVLVRPRKDWFDDVGGLAWFVAVGGIVAPAIAAIPGGKIADLATPGWWFQNAMSWQTAHGLGTVIGFPMIYLATTSSFADMRARWSRPMALELAGHLVLVAAVSLAAIGQPLLPLLFVPIVPLLLAAFRGGREGAALGTLIVALVATWSFSAPSSMIAQLAIDPAHKLLFVQFYIATISMLALPASVALRQHQLLMTELEERKALKLLIAEHSDDALLNLDARGHIRYASPAADRLTGTHDLTGKSLAMFFDPLDELLVRATLSQAATAPGQTHSLERPMLRGDEQRWLEAKVRAVAPDARPGSLQGFAVTIRDVTDRKHAELDAIQAAETDALTGLPNRRALLSRLETSLAHAGQRSFAVAIIDLDHFKAINDTHGHQAGDDVLREVAGVLRRMSSHARFFARLGGEEFALVAGHADFGHSADLCEELRAAIAALRLNAPDGTAIRATASIGLTQIAASCAPSQALQAADALLYRAKHSGRNRVEVGDSARLPAANRRAA